MTDESVRDYMEGFQVACVDAWLGGKRLVERDLSRARNEDVVRGYAAGLAAYQTAEQEERRRLDGGASPPSAEEIAAARSHGLAGPPCADPCCKACGTRRTIASALDALAERPAQLMLADALEAERDALRDRVAELEAEARAYEKRIPQLCDEYLTRIAELEATVARATDEVNRAHTAEEISSADVLELEATVARVRAVLDRYRGSEREVQQPLVHEIDAALAGPAGAKEGA